MIRFSVYVNKDNPLEQLLKSVDEEYLTLLINEKSVYFIVNSAEYYVHSGLNIIDSTNLDEVKVIRINRKKFLELLTQGKLVFVIEDNKIKIDFYKDVVYAHTLKVRYQEALFEKYVNSLKLFLSADEYPLLRLKGVDEVVRIAKTLGASITCSNNVMQVNAKGGVFIFKEFDGAEFTINSAYLQLLMKHSLDLRNVNNYLVYHNEGTCIAVRKMSLQPNSSYDYIIEQPSSHKIIFKMTSMLELGRKLKLIDGDLILNLDKNVVTYVEEFSEATTNIEILEKVSARDKKTLSQGIKLDLTNKAPVKVSKYPTIKIPNVVVKSILKNLKGSDVITLYIKKNFIFMDCNGVKLAFRKDIIE
ncbi:hypothetical protein [Paraclostridium bifermentans]|uniref:hypothetical protein n=1 Tax=Paraclostridium bifermentans TaxID=1490 RepID=UPI00374F7CA5